MSSSGDVVRLLKTAANMVGARAVGTLFIGLASQRQHQYLGARARKKAYILGHKLALMSK